LGPARGSYACRAPARGSSRTVASAASASPRGRCSSTRSGIAIISAAVPPPATYSRRWRIVVECPCFPRKTRRHTNPRRPRRVAFSTRELPADLLAREEWLDRGLPGPDRRRNSPGAIHQSHALLVGGKTVETRAVERRKSLEAIDRILLRENLRVELQRRRRGEDAGA